MSYKHFFETVVFLLFRFVSVTPLRSVNMDAALGDRTPLLAEEGGLRQRQSSDKPSDRYKPGDDWDPSIPYGGKVYLARKKKPDPLWVRILEVSEFSSLIYDIMPLMGKAHISCKHVVVDLTC